MIEILAISGSLRQVSSNTALLEAAIADYKRALELAPSPEVKFKAQQRLAELGAK